MANDYGQVTTSTGIELVGGQKTRTVTVYEAYTTPNNVYFSVRIADNLLKLNPNLANLELETVAGNIEGALRNPHVDSLAYLQDTNLSGDLLDLFDVAILSTSGESSKIVRFHIGDLDPLVFDRLVEPVVHQLDAEEAL